MNFINIFGTALVIIGIITMVVTSSTLYTVMGVIEILAGIFFFIAGNE